MSVQILYRPIRGSPEQEMSEPGFHSRFYVPGTEGVNAFAFDWSGEKRFLVLANSYIMFLSQQARLCFVTPA